LPELRDRCTVHKDSLLSKSGDLENHDVNFDAPPPVDVDSLQFLSKCDNFVQDGKYIEMKANIRSSYQTLWRKEVLDEVKKRDNFVLLIVSSPGAGKTYLMEDQIIPLCNEQKIESRKLDGSNDELVEIALMTILDKTFFTQARSLLIVDEYHLLSGEDVCPKKKNKVFFEFSCKKSLIFFSETRIS